MPKFIIHEITNPNDPDDDRVIYRWEIRNQNVTITGDYLFSSKKNVKRALRQAAFKYLGFHLSAKRVKLNERTNLDLLV